MDKLIIVDDEEWVRYFIAHGVNWKKHGLQVAGEGENGKKGLELCRMYRPAILITDIRMPGLDGVALFKTVHGELPDTKVIVLSGYDDFTYAREAMREDVFDYLLKPVSRDVLEETVSRALQERRTRSAERKEHERIKLEVQKLRQVATNAGEKDSPGLREEALKVHPAVQKAMKIIDEEYADPLSLENLAGRIFVSPRYLSGLFKSETGSCFIEYLTDRRIKAAGVLLKEDVFHINEIAGLVGYQDGNYFSRVFKKKTGFTPKEFREQK